MKVFNSNEFVEKLKWLVTDVPNIYWSENGTWCTLWNGMTRMDCVTSIKGLLWGFINDYSINSRGGADYKSNGVTDDFTANGGIDHCTDISQDFHNLQVGEYLCMWGSPYEHCGVYLGNGKVFECTPEWNTGKCIISNIDANGTRTYNGMGSPANWTWHGKLEYIDYVEQPKIKLRGFIQDIGWSNWQDNSCGTMGESRKLEAFQIDAPDFKINVKAHIENIGWIDYGIINKDTTIGEIGKRMEALQILADELNYQVHCEIFGWSNTMPCKKEYSLGTMGFNKRIEAVVIRKD